MTMPQATAAAAPATLLGSEQALCAAYDVALLDLDGVCFAGEARVPHAADNVNAARRAGMHLSFVTNNASRAPQTVVDKLVANGITAEASEVFSAAMDAAAMLTEHIEPGSTVLVVGGDGVRQALLDEGFQVTSSAQDEPVAVVQGWDPAVDWALLSEGGYAINAGALHAAPHHASGKEPLAGGKPFPGIYTRALKRAGGTRPLAVGDRLNTDHVGARAAGIPGLHVLTGVSDARDVIAAPATERPSFLHTDLRGLTEPHPEPVRTEQDGQVWWRVGNRSARALGSGLELQDAGAVSSPDGTPVRIDLDSYRALAVAAWDWADAQGRSGEAAALELPEIEVIEP